MTDADSENQALNRPLSPKGSGHLFVLSAPSGAGKTTLCKAVLDRFPALHYSISYTTRKPRPGEVNGSDYFFITPEGFKKKLHADRWAEWANVHGNYYGTSADFLESELSTGNDVLLDIDVQGAKQILARYSDRTVAIFIMPPSMEALKERLATRGADSSVEMEKRLKNAAREMEQKDLYHHVIVNDCLSEAIHTLSSLIDSYRTCKLPIGRSTEPSGEA